MTLTIDRDKEFVNNFHFDARNLELEKETGTPESNLNVQFQLLPKEQLAEGVISDEDTAIYAIVTYMLPLDTIVISGMVSQLNYIRGRVIEEQAEMDQEEVAQLAAPLLELLRRLVYETTEVAFDQPGINLNF